MQSKSYPENLDEINFVKKLGEGYFGEVFQVDCKGSGENYALKMIKSSGFDSKLFKREVELLYKLNHENVMKCLNFWAEDGQAYILLELCAGGDLEKYLNSKKPSESIWKIFIQICEGLNYLHQNDVLHRDLKPANILLTRDGNVKIGDLGLAKQAYGKYWSAAGTEDYFAPELLNRSSPNTKQTDVWALGMILKKLAEIKSDSSKFQKIIDRCLTKDPKHRPSVDEVLRTSKDLQTNSTNNSTNRAYSPSSLSSLISSFKSKPEEPEYIFKCEAGHMYKKENLMNRDCNICKNLCTSMPFFSCKECDLDICQSCEAKLGEKDKTVKICIPRRLATMEIPPGYVYETQYEILSPSMGVRIPVNGNGILRPSSGLTVQRRPPTKK